MVLSADPLPQLGGLGPWLPVGTLLSSVQTPAGLDFTALDFTAPACFWSLSTDPLDFGCRGLDCHVNTLVAKDLGSSAVGPSPPRLSPPSPACTPGPVAA